MADESKTPFVDELCTGPWPSHVTELKKSDYVLEMYEEALKQGASQWRGGGFIAVPGVPNGVLARSSNRPDLCKGSSVVRIFPPPGLFFSTKLCRALCELADRYGGRMTHLFATTSDIELLDVPGEKIPALVKEVEALGLDVGSTDAALRTVKACIGPARCDVALMDTIAFRQAFTKHFLDDMQYPRFPHKIKTKAAGCPNDCVIGSLKSELFVCGTFRDSPVVDGEKLSNWVEHGGDVDHLCSRCPTGAMQWDNTQLAIDADACIHCMYCINKCPAISPGLDRGVSLMVGAKFRSKYGPTAAKVLVPFMKSEPPDFKELLELIGKVVDVYDEHH